MNAETFRIVRNADYRPAHLALAHRYSRLEDAVADMGEGIVVKGAREIVAFHERHLAHLQRHPEIT